MKITNIRIRQLEGVEKRDAPEKVREKVCLPLDIYPEFRSKGGMAPLASADLGGGRFKITRPFVQIDTDEGVSGICGPINLRNPMYYIDTQLRPFLIGRDPTANEYLWDIMYRNADRCRKGDNMVAISLIDTALWDLKGKWLGKPVYKLLGGLVQEKIPVYASMAGYSTEPSAVRDRMKELRAQGYSAAKWFMRQVPQDGPEGIRNIVAIAKAAREAGGPDMGLMMDAMQSWGNIDYTLKIANLIKEYDFDWIEEPLMADMYQNYAFLTAHSPVKISAGEYEYTRWGFKLMMDMHAADIYQPDPLWCGGITETVKICTLASAYGFPTPLHASLPNVVLQISLAQNPVTCPIMEFLLILDTSNQFFFKEPVRPVNGFFYPPKGNGLWELDMSKVEKETEIKFR